MSTASRFGFAAVAFAVLWCGDAAFAAQRSVAALAPPAGALSPVVRGADPTVPAPATRGWLDTVTESMREGEYHLSPKTDAEGWTAPSRRQGLRGWWHDGALEVTPRVEEGAWRFTYRLASLGRAGDRTHDGTIAAPSFERVDGSRIEWERDGLVEWYVNDERGIEQGFTLGRRPEGDARDLVVIEGWIDGLLAYPSEDGASVLLRTADGVEALRIRDLVVVDASGAKLPACLSVGAGVLQVWLDDAGAQYPVTVDPLLTSPAWTAEGDQDNARFGYSVATAGDVNGDGYSDVIVAAYGYDNGQVQEGRAFVHHGSASGLSTTAAWTAEGDQDSANFGYSVATAGDVNGDGYSDVIVGARGYTNGQTSEGGAFVYHGSASGLSTTAASTAEGGQDGARLGTSVATAGDVNGDGYSDVIVGASGYDNGQVGEGAAFAYHGSASGLATTAAWTAEGDQDGAQFGISVATAGDVNGDGYSDVIVGANFYDNGQADEGRALVYHGSASGLSTTAAWMAESDQASAYFGISVATAGDVNGDGYSDVIVGAPQYSNGQPEEGRAFAYHGSASGLSTTAAWTAEGDQFTAYFGFSVATAGDVNGDGYSDVVVGALFYDNGQGNEGRAFVYHGSASGLSTTSAWTAESDQLQASFGISVATAGDVNGDGYSDVIVGADTYDNGQTNEGGAFVYHGSASGLATTAAWTAEGDKADAGFGFSVATAGDVNGDGYSDVIVGAYPYDNVQPGQGRAFVYHGSASGLSTTASWTADGDQAQAWFGFSVATAGDVNGDGYSDVIVGAIGYDNGQADEGRGFVYHGSASGLSTTAAWTAEGDQDQALFGTSVATAGDVNGDGYSDVIVGAYGYANGQTSEGRAFSYHGSASGLSTTAAWTAESDQIFARFGYSVATAGDVNGDGYSDVIVGAYSHDNGQADEGRAFVYHGSAPGLSTTAAWTAESDRDLAQFGASVATAGDVNGDGYSDVIVGAFSYDNGQTDEGRGFVYHGSVSGLSTTAAWTAEGDQDGAEFGISVATAGDVNGDGYSDVIVGAHRYANGQSAEGRAFVYHGSASGLSTMAAWTAESDQRFAFFGISIATAGDVNGDGYSDVIVGAATYDNGQTDEGGAFLYHGNGGDGLDRLPHQRRAGGTPLDMLDAVTDASGFRAKANGRSPFGRDRVRLEAEVEPLGTAFDGSGLLTTPYTDTGVPGASGSVVPLDVLVAPLAPGPHHWRVRLRGTFPFPWQSHWMGMPYNNLTETDLRAAADVPPACDAGPDLSPSCDAVQLDGTGTDPLGDALAFRWSAACAATFTPSADVEDPVVTFGAGCASTCDLTLTVDDGNGGTCSDVVRVDVNDLTPPAAACAADIVVGCPALIPLPDPSSVTASDCGAPATVTHVGDVTTGSCPTTIARTYRATDACLNTTDCTQTITVDDTTPPSIACPADLALDCGDAVPLPDTASVAASDDCGAPVTVTHVGDVTTGSCPTTIARTYRATDACLNTADCTQTITVDDTTPPSIACPADVALECGDAIPLPDTASVAASDDCGAPVTVTHVGDVTTGICPMTVERTYRATDACDNAADCTQVISLVATIETACGDGADDDGDTSVDCRDSDCVSDPAGDCDADGSPNGADCDPADPTAFAVPPPVDRLDVAKAAASGDALLSWTDVSAAAGSGTRYDVVGGVVSDLWLDRGFASASCVTQDAAVAAAVDARSMPPHAPGFAGDGWYYLVRAQDACGASGYGSGTTGARAIDPTLCD